MPFLSKGGLLLNGGPRRRRARRTPLSLSPYVGRECTPKLPAPGAANQRRPSRRRDPPQQPLFLRTRPDDRGDLRQPELIHLNRELQEPQV
jgi:hypothetical protein